MLSSLYRSLLENEISELFSCEVQSHESLVTSAHYSMVSAVWFCATLIKNPSISHGVLLCLVRRQGQQLLSGRVESFDTDSLTNTKQQSNVCLHEFFATLPRSALTVVIVQDREGFCKTDGRQVTRGRLPYKKARQSATTTCRWLPSKPR